MPSREPDGFRVRLLQALLLAGTLAAWEFWAGANKTLHFFVSRPSVILIRAWEWLQQPKMWADIAITLEETFLGFAGGVTLGLLLAFACYRSRLLERVIMPFFGVLNAMPRLIFGPIFILWFGLGVTSKAVLGASIIVFIVFFSTFTGLKEVDRNLINKVRLLGGSEGDVLRHVLLPSALTWVFTSLRTSVGFALVGAIVGEYMGSSKGLGNRIQFAEGMFDATGVFAGLLILSLLVIVINTALERVEARFTGWRPQ